MSMNAITLSTLRWVSNADLRLLMDHMWLGVETFDKRNPAVAGVFYTIYRGLAREHQRRRAMVDAILAATWAEAGLEPTGATNLAMPAVAPGDVQRLGVGVR